MKFTDLFKDLGLSFYMLGIIGGLQAIIDLPTSFKSIRSCSGNVRLRVRSKFTELLASCSQQSHDDIWCLVTQEECIKDEEIPQCPPLLPPLSDQSDFPDLSFEVELPNQIVMHKSQYVNTSLDFLPLGEDQ